jgi:hypothetical protein
VSLAFTIVGSSEQAEKRGHHHRQEEPGAEPRARGDARGHINGFAGYDVSKVPMRLSAEQYDLAVQGHRAGTLVTVVGDLERNGNLFWLPSVGEGDRVSARVRECLFDGFAGTASTLVEQEFRVFVEGTTVDLGPGQEFCRVLRTVDKDLGNHGAVARALNKALDLS